MRFFAGPHANFRVYAKMIDLTNIGKEIAQLTSAHSSAGLFAAVYVFGSAVGSNFKESSDIDLSHLWGRV
jgi:predicted nucleotidyltransferase